MSTISIIAGCLAYIAAFYTAGRLGTRLPGPIIAALVGVGFAAVAAVWWRSGPGAAVVALVLAGFWGWYGIRHGQDRGHG